MWIDALRVVMAAFRERFDLPHRNAINGGSTSNFMNILRVLGEGGGIVI